MLPHTRGTWAATKSSSHNGYAVHSIDPNTTLDISVFAPYGGREKEWREQALADATLVAAAPDLLAALEAFIGRDMESSHAAWPEVTAARAAINKAKGA